MARPAGFEPTTYRLEGGCSILLSYGRMRGAWGNYRIGFQACQDRRGPAVGPAPKKLEQDRQRRAKNWRGAAGCQA